MFGNDYNQAKQIEANLIIERIRAATVITKDLASTNDALEMHKAACEFLLKQFQQ